MVVPDTKDLEGGWGYIKVSGTIDDYDTGVKNLMPQKGKDMRKKKGEEKSKGFYRFLNSLG